jgi:hypothetical protein
MERFKSLSEVCQPDIRYRGRVDLDKTTGTVSETTIESIYDLIQPIALGAKVPDELRSHFETAKNLALYSWFVYSFSVVAAMHAFALLEMALRTKSKKKNLRAQKSPGSLRQLRYVGSIVKDVGVSVAAEAIVKAAGG